MADPQNPQPTPDPKNPRGLPFAANVRIKVGGGRVFVAGDRLINSSRIKLPNEVEAVDPTRLLADGTYPVVGVGYVSNSQMNTYARCHRLWWYEYGGERRRMPRLAIKMWHGSAVHTGLEVAGEAELAGKRLPLEDVLKVYDKEFGREVQGYEKAVVESKKEGMTALPELEFPERINSFEDYRRLGQEVLAMGVKEIIHKVKILTVEEAIVGHLDVHSGGEIPFVGLSDLEEEDPVDGPVIMDYKTGRKRTHEDFDKDDQLTLYSILKKNPHVGWYSLVMGTTGGQTPKRAKPPELVKLRAKKTIKDQERLVDDFNFHLEGIKAGNFARTGKMNSQICAPNLCQYYAECLGKK